MEIRHNYDRATFPEFSLSRRTWRVIYPVLLFIGTMFAVAIPFTIAAFARVYADDGVSTIGDLTEAVMLQISGQYMLIQILSQALTLAIMLPMWLKTRTYLPKFKRRNLVPATAIAIFAVPAVGVVSSLLWSLTGVKDPMSEAFDSALETMQEQPFLLQILSSVVLAPLIEELCLRGVTLNRSTYWLPKWAAVVLTAALFAAAHMNLTQGIPAMFSGAVMAVIYLRYRSIWVCIAAHLGNNLIAVIQMNYLVDSKGNLLPGANAVEIAITVLGIIALIAIPFLKGAEPLPSAEPLHSSAAVGERVESPGEL
ncbi:MAG: CPBP family intramembrane metalloprotease [Oscillospiraceae bacterium]|jgi:membrane protease YdiL (CAAX protease family)|nr:CPBP family intramembrane metalloprotease [Oscillospiraceae bacterium]